MKLLFTKQLLQQLKQQGYTHIQQRGIESKSRQQIRVTDDPSYDYILIPVRQTDFSLEDVLRVLPIDSTDVSDMLDVEFGIDFYVELPDSASEE